jgi:predicted acyltransferase
MSTSAIPAASSTVSPIAGKPARLLSLDLLRGITIAFMILVNNAGSESDAYWPLQHAAWNGFTPTDLVFPTFLLLVGVSLVLAVNSRLARGATRMSILVQALRRAAILILLGVVVNSFPFFHLSTMRFFGVLQRIGICYLIATVLLLIDRGWRSKLAVAVSALVGYWLLMRFVPIPGYGVPTHAVALLDPDLNIAAWTDRHLFSAAHLYEHTRDPEGLLSTIPAVATILIGVLCGFWIRTSHTVLQKLRGIAIAGAGLVGTGLLWNIWFPINKKLWTSSYVLFAAGLSLLLFAFTIFLVDVRKSGTTDAERDRHPRLLMPFFVFGVNSIAAYVVSELLAPSLDLIHIGPKMRIPQWLYLHLLRLTNNASLASLIYSLLFVAACWVPIYVLYRKRIMIKV